MSKATEDEINNAIAVEFIRHVSQCSKIDPAHMFEIGFLKGVLFMANRADSLLTEVFNTPTKVKSPQTKTN